MRREDRKLEQKVSLSAGKIYIGDLVEKLRAQVGVGVFADERTGASDEIVMLTVKEVALADAFDALWSLMSYRGGWMALGWLG